MPPLPKKQSIALSLRHARDCKNMIIDILTYSLSSLFWGLLVALACMGLFVLLVKGWYKDAMFSLVTWFELIMLFILLSFQCTMLVGSLKIMDNIDDFERHARTLIEQYIPEDELVTEEESQAVLCKLIETYPLLKYYVGSGEFKGFTASELPHAMASTLSSYLKWYIFRRLLWCVAFVVAAAFFTIRSLSNNNSRMSTRRQRNKRRTYRRKI